MKYTLLTLILLVALVAFEMLCIKLPTRVVLNSLIYLVSFFVMGVTWGAFCLAGKSRQFCIGACVLAWAWILYAIFVRVEDMSRYPSSPLSRYVGEMLEHGKNTSNNPRRFPGEEGDDSDIEVRFIKIWTLLAISNAGIVGGFLGMQRYPGKTLVSAARSKNELDPELSAKLDTTSGS